jgi:hypothetical protein
MAPKYFAYHLSTCFCICTSQVILSWSRSYHQAPRPNRSFKWGPFDIAYIYSTGSDEIIGCGGTCGIHVNAGDDARSTKCKKMITLGKSGMTFDEARLRIKNWLLMHVAEGADERKRHVNMNIRAIPYADLMQEVVCDTAIG